MAYAELHCHSNFSFLDGASHPEELVEEAARLGLAALAVTDHDGFYGDRALRGGGAARVGLPTVFGAELTLGAARQLDPNGEPPIRRASTWSCSPRAGRVRAARPGDQRGAAGGGEGRAALHRSSSSPTRPRAACTSTATARAPRNDSWFVLTGCRKGAVPRALLDDGPAAARRALDRLVDAFGRDRVLVELWDHGDPLDRHRNDALAQVAVQRRCRGGRDQQRALRHARGSARSRPRSRRSGPAVRSTRSTAGCPRRRSRTCASPAEQAAAVRALARRGRAHGRDRARRARST